MKTILSILAYTFISLISISVMAQVSTFKVGRAEVSLLNENSGEGNTDILIGATPKMLDKTIPSRTYPNAVNAFLVKTEDKNILVDAGFGSKLFTNLLSLGVKPEQVDVVLLTHMHGDHIGGMLKSGEKSFTNARVYVSKAEYDYWTNDVEMSKLPANRQGSFASARAVFAAYKDHLEIMDIADVDHLTLAIDMLPEIKAIQAPGHTPGHTMFLVRSEDDQLLIWGDLTHALAVQIAYPTVAVTYDVNPDLAIKSRATVLKHVADNDIPVVGMHVPAGVIKIKVNGDAGYTFEYDNGLVK